MADIVKEPEPETASPVPERGRAPSLLRNFTSLFGIAVVLASLTGIFFLFLAESVASHEKPYLGIFAYIIFPAVLVLGIAIMTVGAFLERRRRRGQAPSEYGAYPMIDLNDPIRRRKLLTFLGVTFLFLFVSAFGSYRAYEYTESVTFCGQLCHEVMNPEFVTYQSSPHARVRCVDCHVGPGAGWYVRSKLSGAYQVYSVMFNKFPRPIPTPVENLRPAQDTCEQCHWPEKFYGAQMKIFNRFGYDENNTLRQTRMLIHTGGGSPTTGLVTGIHWHMNIANEITYVSTDDRRQVIPWVRMKDMYGNVEEFTVQGSELSRAEIDSMAKRKMDCVDCHNRPSHIFNPPDRSVNEAFLAGRLDQSLPYLKREAVAALTKPYASTADAVSAIATSLDQFYRANYGELYPTKEASISAAISEIQRIYATNFFPEMKVDWQTHQENAGHFYSVGCFRCHDGKHVSRSGKVIRSDCNICHETLDQRDGNTIIPVKDGAFEHFGFFGNLNKYQCTDCHTGKGVVLTNFKHPQSVDISGQKCADCHGSGQ
jgi:nitrate/TMAO reductase-like tetraheme cytochrome c subunit